MNIKAWMSERIEGVVLGRIAAKLDAGEYGPRAQAIYRAGKGYLTYTSAAIGLVALFATQVDNTGAASVITQVSAVGAGLGLVRKGAHMQPPEIPPAMRDALEIGGSIVAWLLGITQAVIWLCQQSGSSWACGVSSDAQFAGLVLTAVSGFLATWAARPPEEVNAPAKGHET